MDQRRHLSRALLDAYFLGQASEFDLAAEVARVLEGECEGCERGLAGARVGYERALRAANRRARVGLAELEEERRGVPRLLVELAKVSEAEALLLVAGDRRFHTIGFVEYELGAAWAGLDGEVWEAAGQAMELACAAAVRLDARRYGKMGVSALRAEAELTRARVAVARGSDRELRAGLEAAGGWVASSLSAEAQAGLLLGKAVLALRAGDAAVARSVLATAEEIGRRGGAGRWWVAIETMVAALDRREGRPEAADRLRGLAAAVDLEAGGRVRWRAAHELVAALVASSEPVEAAAFVSAWEGRVESGGGAETRVSVGAAELAHLRGLVLRGPRRPDRGEMALRWAFGAYAALGLGLRALAVGVELARGAVGESAPAGSREWLGRALEVLVARAELPGEALEALAGFGRSLWRGTLTEAEVREFEERVLRVDPPWGLDDDESR